MYCGSHRWSVSGQLLTIQHEVRPIDRWLSRGAIVAALAFPVISLRTGILASNGHAWLAALLLGASAAHHLWSRWKVLLNLETRTLWRHTGYGVSFSRQTQPLEPFTSVALCMRGERVLDGPMFPKVYSVALTSPTRALVLSGSDDREEALELAQAVSRFLGLGLSVEGGQSRSVTARLEEAPLQEGTLSLPEGSRIRFSHSARGLMVELPACGWRFVRTAQAAIAVLIGLGGPILLLVLWSRAFGGIRSAFSQVPLISSAIFIACGAFLLWRVVREATSTWSIIASSRGIELAQHGRWRKRTVTRLPASRIQDIDLRDTRTEVSRGKSVVIEHDKGIETLGMDLSQAELEWTETMLRRALATRAGPGRQDALPGPMPRVRATGGD